MSTRVDSVGTFIFEVLELGVNLTSKNKYPQAVARLKAVQKYIEDAETMAHFKLTEPGYVDWAGYDEEIDGYFVLFNSATELTDETKLKNYEQLVLALGWDGNSFDGLADGSFVGKRILGRLEEDTYEGKTSIKVKWIDKEDASPTRTLKALDPAAIKGLNALLRVTKSTKPAAAKPAAAKPVAGKAPAGSAAPAATAPAPAPKSPSKAPKAKPVVQEAAPAASVARATTKLAAWEYVITRKGDNSDTDVEEAWSAAAEEVGPDKSEEDFTPEDWYKVQQIVVKDLDLK